MKRRIAPTTPTSSITRCEQSWLLRSSRSPGFSSSLDGFRLIGWRRFSGSSQNQIRLPCLHSFLNLDAEWKRRGRLEPHGALNDPDKASCDRARPSVVPLGPLGTPGLAEPCFGG